QRDISATIEDIYGFSVSHEMISDITDQVLPELEEWQTRPLKNCYAFVFVDCMYTTIRNEYETRKNAIYNIMGYTMENQTDIHRFWLNEKESKHKWMQIYDEIKSSCVEDIFFI